MKQNESNFKKGRKDERTHQVMEKYMQLHFGDGLAPREIAERYEISLSTLYGVLGEIAKRNGVSRESLLQNPGRGNFGHAGNDFGLVRPIDSTGFKKNLQEVIHQLEEAENRVKATLSKGEL